jgi:hypothetical protein
MTNMCVSPRVLIYEVVRTESVNSQGDDEDGPNFGTHIFPVLSRSTALLSITYKKGAEKKRRGNVTTRTTNY